MKPIKVLIMALLLSGITGNAQTMFLKNYGDVNYNNHSGHATDYEGNSFLVDVFSGPELNFGGFTLTSDYGYTPYIAKINGAGDVEWIFAEINEATIEVYDIILDNDNNIIICGIFYGADAVFSGITLTNNGSNSFIAKYDHDGNILWAQSVSGNGPSFSQIAVDDNDNILVTGNNSGALTFMGEEIEEFGDYDVIYAKFDKNGNALWLKSLGSNGSDTPYEIAADHDGNIFLSVLYTASFSIDGFNFMNHGLSDALILKLNPEGEAMWGKIIYGPSDGYDISGITIDEANDVYLCTELNSDDLLFGEIVPNYGLTDVFLVKMHGDDGAVSWYRSGGSSNYDHSEDIVLGKDGVFISGNFMGAAEFDGLQLYGENVGTFIVAYTRDGDIVQVYQATGNNFVIPNGLDVDKHGNVYCSGTFSENIIVEDAPELTTNGTYDIFLYKFGSVLVDINTTIADENSINIFPNPATENITFHISEFSDALAKFKILNYAGQVVSESLEINLADQIQFNIQHLASGIYTVVIFNEENIINSQKFIKL
ncbi:MAG: T9SS type A sorting domain-containing protein [Bacteroidetes bacterium]|jgi:hypothetical protein|nr:T9SS type A sorting domain-containing protein [Bacteroidota bacterium]MBP9796233.1 T9SS type A sorting domain-containing protein [Chitinophagales bacterium]